MQHTPHSERYASLDSLRGILALVVFVGHCWLAFVAPVDGHAVNSTHTALVIASRFAVIFFFVLSGYVIAASIDANRKRHGRFDGWDFALSRAFRILPPLLLTIAVTWVLSVVLLVTDFYWVSWDGAERHVYYTDPIEQLIAIATLTVSGEIQGHGFNGPLWSLGFEVRAYVMAGLLALIVSGRLWAAVPLAAYIYGIETPAPARQAVMLVAFGLGSAAYAARKAPVRWLWLAAVVFAAVLVAVAAPLSFKGAQWRLDNAPWLVTGVAAAALFGVGLIAACRTDCLARLSWLGAGSYTLYILHFPILQAVYFVSFNLLARAGTAEWANWLAVGAGAFTLAVCMAAGRWVERPHAQRAWVAALVSRRRDQPAATVTASA